METPFCISCRSNKPRLICGLCKENLCKHCAHFVDENTFAYAPADTVIFPEGAYCHVCYDNQISEPLEAYTQLLDQAKSVIVFTKDQTKETRYYKRSAAPFKVAGCGDSQDVIMKLAFMAIKAEYNGIIDVDLKPQKVITNEYQSTVWSGTAIPTRIDAEKLARLEEVCTYQRNASS